MTEQGFADSSPEKPTLLDLEEPIADLRDGIAALLAMKPHIAIGEAGILWIAGKLEETVQLLFEQWRDLAADARSPPADREESED